jgi:excisionase family DNA binding protein
MTTLPGSDRPRLIRIPDAARDISISERHLREQILRGRIPIVRIGRSVRISREVLDRIVAHGIP